MSAHVLGHNIVRSALGISAIVLALVLACREASASGRIVEIEQLGGQDNPVGRARFACASADCYTRFDLLIDDRIEEVGLRASFRHQEMQVTLVSQRRELAINSQIYAVLLLHSDGTGEEIVDLHEHGPLLRSDQPSILLHRPVYRGSLRKLGKLRITVMSVDNLGRIRIPRDRIIP